MVEEPTTVTPPPPRRHRAKASHGRIFLRRVVALAFVLGVLAILVGSAWAILGGREEAAPPPRPLRSVLRSIRIVKTLTLP